VGVCENAVKLMSSLHIHGVSSAYE